MKLQGILSTLGLVAIAGAAAPACPEDCENECCASAEGEHVRLIELTSDDDLPKLIELESDDENVVRRVQSVIRSHDGDGQEHSVVVKIVNDDVSASVNGKDVQPHQVIRKDGKIIIKIEGQDDIVVPIMSGGNWTTFTDAAPGFRWRSGGDGNFVFAPEGNDDFTVFQPEGAQRRAIIGINISDANKELIQQIGLDGAVRIDGVIDGTPAAKAGIKANDLLIKLNGQRVANVEKLRELLGGKNPGDEVKVQVLRQGDSKSFAIKLAPSASFGDMNFGGEVIELSPEFNVDIDVEGMLKELKDKHGNTLELHGHLDKQLQDKLHHQLKDLHIELAPLHDKLQGKVFGELRNVPRGEMMFTPRLRLHSGTPGVFKFEGGKGEFQFDTEHDVHIEHDGDLSERLNDLEDRLSRLEEKLDRLAAALGGRERQ